MISRKHRRLSHDERAQQPMQFHNEHPSLQDDLRDLGFGSRVSQQTRLRLLNRDGTFNVDRAGFNFLQVINAYTSLLEMPWWRFHLTMFGLYLCVNTLFASAYILCGAGALNGVEGAAFLDRFRECFFFSIQTFTTIGYGHITPNALPANLLVTVEAFVGPLSFALATGLLFARFSRPTAKILFSETALIAPYRGLASLQFRIANKRRNQLIDVEARVLLTYLEEANGKRSRHYRQLRLEREKVAFFPLHWTIVHPIDETSPLHGFDLEDFREKEGEILVLLTAVDDTFSQMVHTRTSYRFDEVIWGAKFVDIFVPSDDGILHVDLRHLHDYESVPDLDGVWDAVRREPVT